MMKLLLLGLYITFCLVSIARAQGGGNHTSSPGNKTKDMCDRVYADITLFLDVYAESFRIYFQEATNIHLRFTGLCSTFKIQFTTTEGDVTTGVQGCIKDYDNPMVNFSTWGDCSAHTSITDKLRSLSTTIGPTTFSSALPTWQKNCSYTKCSPCTSSSTRTEATTTTTTTAKTPKTSSLSTSISKTAQDRMSSVTNTATVYSSRNTVPLGANTDKMQGTCGEVQGLSIVIVGVTSFLAGTAVVLLCVWILYLKRSSKLCFAKPEKTPEKLTSDRVTKKVLAKHMLSATKDTSVTNAVYFTNETRDTDTATATNSKAQAFEDGQGHMNMSKYGDKESNALGVDKNSDKTDNGPRVYTTLQETEIKPPSMGAHQQTDDEHVYRELDLDHKVDINNAQKDGNNLKVMDQLGILGKADSDVYDHARESAISNHDYFVLQNENFRSSHQPGTQTLNSEFSNAGNQMEHPEDTENTYFKLEKQ